MSQRDERAEGVRRTGSGTGSMLAAMAVLWTGGASAEDTENLPQRYTAATLVLWTLLGVAAVVAIHLLRAAAGSTSPLWLVGLLVVFLPLVLAGSTDPPRRTSGLVWGLLLGAVAGVAVVAGAVLTLGSAVLDLVLMLVVGCAVTALVAAWVFGTVTRDRPAPPA